MMVYLDTFLFIYLDQGMTIQFYFTRNFDKIF